MGQEKTFYEELQKSKDLDLRDNRGKRHKMSFVLLSLTIGLLRKRDGFLSSLHRSMVNTHEELCNFLNIENERVISRSQLPILLERVNLCCFEKLLFDYFKIELSESEKTWFSGDGKELRGSILRGDKRGSAIVQIVRQSDRAVLGQDFYDGTKESEKPTLCDLLKETGASSQKITADALHLSPETTKTIANAGGIFLIGLKENQKELLADMSKDASFLSPVNQLISLEKGHGRIDKRTYFHYDVSWEYFDERWEESNFQSLFKVIRQRTDLATGEVNIKTAYYISNGKEDGKEDFFSAIRHHWAVEVNNHIRDVTLKEDNLRTKKRA